MMHRPFGRRKRQRLAGSDTEETGLPGQVDLTMNNILFTLFLAKSID